MNRWIVSVMIIAGTCAFYSVDATSLSRVSLDGHADWDSPIEALTDYVYGQERDQLHAVTRMVNEAHNNLETRRELERLLIAVIEDDDATVDAKAFACEVLSHIGGHATVFPVASLLSDPVLAVHACVVLERLPVMEANRALRESLDTLSGPLRVGVINALGNRGEEVAVSALTPLLDSPEYGAAAAAALGAIGGDEAMQQLALAWARKGPDAALELGILRGAETAASKGNMDNAVAMFEFLFIESADESLQTAGFTGLLQHRPHHVQTLLKDTLCPDAPHFTDAVLYMLGTADNKAEIADALSSVFESLDETVQETLATALGSRFSLAVDFQNEALSKAVADVQDARRAAVRQNVMENSTITADDPVFPDGHTLVRYLNCGVPQPESDNDGPDFALVEGLFYDMPGVEGAAGTLAHGREQVVYELQGLAPDHAYVLGFTWWDGDDSARMQSVRFSTDGTSWETVLPPTRPAAYNADASTWARVLLPLTGPYEGVETLRVAFVNEEGPNAVVNELFLLQRTEPPRSKRILIVTGDDFAGHDWRTTAPVFAALLREDDRLEVAITESPAFYGSPLLSHYDASVLHFKNYEDRLPLGRECWDGLTNHVAAGNGLVLSHFGCGAFEEWDGFVDVAGRIWNPALPAHDPHGTFTVRMTDEAHPITRGLDDFETIDELYTCLDGDTPITVLCDAVSVVDGEVYPMAFIVENTGGRVFHCVLGHDAQAYEAPEVRALFRRATAWAAGLSPTP